MFIGLALIFLGIVFLLERLDVITIGLAELWPVFLIILGLGILMDRVRRRPRT